MFIFVERDIWSTGGGEGTWQDYNEDLLQIFQSWRELSGTYFGAFDIFLSRGKWVITVQVELFNYALYDLFSRVAL